MSVGLLIILAALLLVYHNRMESRRAAQSSEAIVQQMEEAMPEETKPANPSYLEMYKSMAVQNIGGYDYIGTLSVPSLGLELPVMSEWDYSRLKIAPCRYSGSYYHDDMVVCAHNYESHFGKLRTVPVGTAVLFTNTEGEVFSYTVDNVETVQPTEIQRMIDNENGQWDLTLYTCHLGGKTRCAVRCIRTNP